MRFSGVWLLALALTATACTASTVSTTAAPAVPPASSSTVEETAPATGPEPTVASTTTSTSTTEPITHSQTTSTITVTDRGQSLFVDALGTSDRVCVDVDHIVATEDPLMRGPDRDVPVFDIRSGEIVAGNFGSIVEQWSAWDEGVVKIYWVPFDHVTAMTEPLQVVVAPLTREDPPETLTFDTVASNFSGTFWPSGTRFPQPGRYRLTATAPGHWGCFEVTV